MRQFGDLVSSLPFGELGEREDLLYYDGPFLTLFLSEDKKHIVFYWCESDSEVNRWLVFEVGKEDAIRLRNEEIGIGELTRKCQIVYLADIDSNLKYRQVRALHPSSILPSYLPDDTFLYSVENTKPYFIQGSSQYSVVESFMKSVGNELSTDQFFEFNEIGRRKRPDVSLSAYHMA